MKPHRRCAVCKLTGARRVSYRYVQSVTLPGEGTIQVDEYGWILPKKTTLSGGTIQTKSYDGLLNLEAIKVQTNTGNTNSTNTNSNTEILNLTNTYGKEQELTRRQRTDTAQPA